MLMTSAKVKCVIYCFSGRQCVSQLKMHKILEICMSAPDLIKQQSKCCCNYNVLVHTKRIKIVATGHVSPPQTIPKLMRLPTERWPG